jgi:kexin
MINPEDSDWERTASGRSFSYKYGYGVLDAFAFVTAAQKWKLVEPQAWLITNTTQLGGGKMAKKHEYQGGVPIDSKDSIEITTAMLLANNLQTLEHIDVRVWINHPRRGSVMVELVSPNGIKSVLADTREDDDAKTGFPGWRFMTIKHWYVLYDLVVPTLSKLDLV